jgi:hypothetical protein
LIESWRVASQLRAVPHVICVHACASAPLRAREATPQQMSPEPARAASRDIDWKVLGFTPLREAAKRWIQGPGEVRQSYDLVLNTAAMSVTVTKDRRRPFAASAGLAKAIGRF